MNTVYSLQFSNQTFAFDKKVEIYHSKSHNNSAPNYFVFLDGKLYRYTYANFNWNKDLILNAAADDQVIYFPRTLQDNESLLLLRNSNGIDFYRYENNKFNILLRSNEYERNPFKNYGRNWNKPGNIIKCGHFYSDEKYIGILSKNKIRGLQFHVVIKENLEPRKIPIYSVQKNNLDSLKNVETSNAHFFLADLKRKGQDNVIVRNRSGLNIYEFDKEELRHFLQVPESSKSNDFEENIFFPDLTGQPFKDIVLFNTSGLFVYQYNVNKKNYQIIHYNPLFDERRGWNNRYIDTIRFEDINFDGKQEMFFTGPQGMDILTFDNYTLQWQSLPDVSGVAVPERHSNVIEVVPRNSINSEYPIVFTHHQNKMHWAQIIKMPFDDDFDELPEENSTDILTSLSAIPKLSKSRIAEKHKLNMLLRDQLDCSTIIKGVNKNTGKANFKLPLIGLPNFSKDEKINLHYNGNNKDANILGVGWSFPVNAILMDHQGSIFPENERYFLLLDDFSQHLIMDSDNSTNNVINFKLSKQESNTQIRYFKLEERWEINFKGITQIYGRSEGSNVDSISYDLAWEHWRGVGSSPSGQIELPTAWFLIEIRSGPSSAIYYTYDINNFLIPESGKKFTREVYLRTISYDDGNKIVFNYAAKDSEEFDLPPLVDADGSYNPKKVQTRYLSGYSISTYDYRQDIDFIYEVRNGNRLLTKILQKDDPVTRPVLQFSYKAILNSHQLEQVILPTGTNVEFSYKVVGGTDLSNVIQKVTLSCPVRNSYRIDYGEDFVLISYLNKYKHVVLKMYNRELTNEMYSSLFDLNSSRFPFLGKKSVLYYEVKILDESLAILLDYGEDKDLCLIHKEKDKWSLDPKYYNYDKDTVIQMGNDFIVVLDAAKVLLEIIVWDKKSNEWIKEKLGNKLIENSIDSLLLVSGEVFFIYDDNIVTVGLRNKNKWQLKPIITLPGMINAITSTLSQFNLHDDTRKKFTYYLKYNAFQISNNFILFNKWNIEGTKLYSEIELFSLNREYEVAHQERHKVFQDDLTEISKDIELQVNGKMIIDFTLAYKNDGNRFKVYINNFKETGVKSINELCKNSENANCTTDLKQEIIQSVNKLSYFILNLEKYSTVLQGSTVISGNTKLTFTGNTWEEAIVTGQELKTQKWSVFIDDKFVLKKDNSESSIKLYAQRKNESEKELLDLEVKNIIQIYNRYPKYLIYQTESEDVKVVLYEFLDNDVIKKFTLPHGETVSFMSNYNTLVTHTQNSDTEYLTLNLRQLFDIKINLPNPVIEMLTVKFDNDYKRITGYDYDPSSAKVIGNTVYYEKTYIIPGNEKFSYGWIEESKNSTGDLNVIKKIYDAQENLINIVREEQSSNVKEQAIKEAEDHSVLLDKRGHLEVAQFYPYEMKNDEVGYYGFEDYEVNKIGTADFPNKKRWFFNETDVVKQKFSLTGQNYLKLENSRLLGTFQPRNQNQNYVASCWIRLQGDGLQIGTIAPYLRAVIYADDNREINGYFSEVKFSYDDWNYLEVVIDLLYSKQVFNNLVSSTHSVPNESPFKAVVTVSPDLKDTLDVDHIRFSPLNSDFQATTYNYKTKEIKEIINANGLIKRYLYNNYQDQIVSIDENGEIEKLNSYTKTSSTDRIVKLKSKIQIRPSGGFYEDFNPHSFIKRWKVHNDQNWRIAPSVLQHRTNQFDQLKLRNMHDPFDSYGIRLHFSLQSELSVIRFNEVLELNRKGSASVALSKKTRAIPVQGEILLIAEHNRLMVWIDGGLYFDEGGLDKLLFDIQIYGRVKIRDLLVLFEPNIHVTYFNALDEKVQEINLESANSAIVTEFIYDEVGRQCITTKSTRLQRDIDEPVVAYYSDFVINKNPLSDDSIWKLGRIQGAFQNLKPYNYYQITYHHNPLNENSAIGLPGQEFSVRGKFAKRFSSTTENAFINKYYPNKKYRYYVEHKLGGIEDVKVFDKRNNVVAMLIKAPGERDLLATYEYNDDGKLIQILSPLYYRTLGTHNRIGSQIQCFSEENNETQNILHVANNYDKMGNIITKTTPDSGKVEYLYNDNGQLQFNIFYSYIDNTAIENVIYFDYDHLGRLTNTGKLISPPSKEELLNLKLTKQNTEEYQLFYHSDFEREPTLRGKLRRYITQNDGMPLIEESLLNDDKSLSSKRIIVLNENSNENLIITTNKKYKADKLIEIEYPADVEGKPFKLTYSYDKLGRIEGIGLPTKRNLFVKYTYNFDGLIGTEHHLPEKNNVNFIRKYNYNSASYLTRLEDKFLTENIYYTEGSYSGHGYGDGTVSRTEFEATWHQYADSDKISLNEQSFASNIINPAESKLCFNKLKNAGYINQYNRQAKIYYPFIEVDFPRICSEGTAGRQIQNVLGKQGFPSKYGHLYDYGAYQELIKAKYFVGEEIPKPLQPETFAKEIPNIDITISRDIWKMLNNGEYLIADRAVQNITFTDEPYFKPHGKKGRSLVRSTLSDDLKTINNNYSQYRLSLEKALLSYFSKKQNPPSFKSNLKKIFAEWSEETQDKMFQERLQNDGDEIIEMLERKGYLTNPLDTNFIDLSEKYQSFIPEIVKVLFEYFSKELGEAEFDVEAYEIDENGNHKHFYRGFEHYELKYRCNSNQIETINFQSFASPKQIDCSVKHDSRGNVIQALHKDIKNITYHPVSNRATSIELVDGKKIIFHYDCQGERVLKKVLDATGEVKKEVHYVRDESGRSLVEREVTWSSPALPPSVLITVYIYGPKGLVGFIRRNEYYSVITDHEGSVRLVVKDGEVVAAYDYLPYGNLMRQYGTNSEAHISYRYTGQEWDEETDLYNYHARFYDPSIGRFYQHDPKMQYFSPYKYAGNSPVSLVDLDGELAFLAIFFMVALGGTGLYLGGAAASNSWNPEVWNFKDPKLYAGLIFGAIGGALVPVMLPASYAAFVALGASTSQSIALTFAVGAAGVYAGMARSTREWNPAKWDWNSPELWNGGFVGFAEFAGAPGGLHTSIKVYRSLPTIFSKSTFITGSVIAGGGLTAIRLSSTEYDFSKPEVYYDILESVIFAADIPMAAIGGSRFFKKNIRNVIESIKVKILLRTGYTSLENLQKLESIWKSVSKLLVGTAIPSVGGVFVSAAYNENGFDFTQPTTYEALINGVMMSSSLNSHAYSYYKKRELKRKQKVNQELIGLAQKSVDEYIKIIQFYEFPKEAYKAPKIRDLLKEKKIPNTVLSVVKMKDDVVFVAYSGLNGPGFLSSFHLQGESHIQLENNRYIGYSPEHPTVPREVALNDNEIVNRAIIEALETKASMLKESNYKSYSEEKDTLNTIFTNLLSSIDEHLSKSYFREPEITNIMEEIGDVIKNTGYISDKETMVKIIANPISRELEKIDKNILNSITKDLKKIHERQKDYRLQFTKVEKQIVELERKMGLPEIRIDGNQDFETVKNLLSNSLQEIKSKHNELNADLTNLRDAKEDAKNVWNEVYKDHFKKYTDEFALWQPINCAEPHVISLLMRSPQIFPTHVGARYTETDIKYLAAYKIEKNREIPELTPKERCSNCQETTRSVTNVITDPEWSAMIESESEKLKNLPKSTFYPYYNITKVHSASNKGVKIYSRKKRSIADNYINNQDSLISATDDIANDLENYENISNDVGNDKSINNTDQEMKNFATNLFGWMKTSLNHLFDSKKILPAKTSTPNVLQGITDSKSSLRAPTAIVDVNSTILLVDTLIRKITGQKYISDITDHNTLLLEARGYSLDVGLAFEKAVKYAASKSGISMHRFNIHFVDIQDKVIDKIMTGRFDEIAEILISHAEKVCPLREKGCPGKLSPKKFDKFIHLFSKRIYPELNDIMETNKSIKNY